MVCPFFTVTEVFVWRRSMTGLPPTPTGLVLFTFESSTSICMLTLRSLVMRGRTLRPMPTGIWSNVAFTPPPVFRSLRLELWKGTSWPWKNFASLLSLVKTRGSCRMRTVVSSERACRITCALAVKVSSEVERSGAKMSVLEPTNFGSTTIALLPLVRFRSWPHLMPSWKSSPSCTSASTTAIITWRPGLSRSCTILARLSWISGGARISSEFCPAFGTTRLLPTRALTSVWSSPAARPDCQGNWMPLEPPPAPAWFVLPLVNAFVLVVPFCPPLATLKSMPVRPSSGLRMVADEPDCASSALRISASSTAPACFSGMFRGMPAWSGWSICSMSMSSHLKLSGVLLTTIRRLESGYASMRKMLAMATSAPASPPPPPPIPCTRWMPVLRPPAPPPVVRRAPPPPPPSSSDCSTVCTLSGSVYLRSYRR